MEISKVNILGASLAVTILAICSLVFIFRLLGYQKIEYWLGIVLILTAIPLTYLLLTANHFQRPTIYYIQIGIMIGFLIIELFLDYVFKLEFRNVTWIIIIYLIFFFGGTGGMIGIASQAGNMWMIVAVILWLIMTTLAFVQRAITGM
ncbi:MAG: hypothetical protein KAU83_03525 [Bacteroidales bacterium]|nr:hypothetical protein [Bacteroidales bacterium]